MVSRTLFLGLLILFSAGVTFAFAGEITPRLHSVLAQQPDDPVRVIITFKDRVTPKALHAGKPSLHSLGKEARRQRRGEMIQTLRRSADASQREARRFLREQGVTGQQELWLINSLAVELPADMVPTLAAMPQVASVTYDEVVYRQIEPQAIPTATPEDNISRINAPALWAQGFAGQGVTIAIVDTGVDSLHPELAPKWRGGTNSWFNAVAPSCTLPGAACTNCDANTSRPCDFIDSAGFAHGTGVAGILVGGDLSGTAIGVAPEAQWIAAKIFDSTDTATLSEIHAAFAWLLDPDGNPLTDDAPDIINNSWGFTAADGCFTEFSADIQLLKAAGIAVVFSGGNDGPNPGSSVSPANTAEGYAVGYLGTMNSDTEIGDFSSRGISSCADSGLFPDLVAPGFNLKSATDSTGGFNPNAYTFGLSGSSFAAPHVSGVMALLLSVDPAMAVSALEQTLVLSAADQISPDDPLGPDDIYGYGLVDALAAFDLISPMLPILDVRDPVLPDDDLALNFGAVFLGDTVRQTLTLRNVGGGTLDIQSINTVTLNAPFSLVEDLCSGQSLSTGQTCTLRLGFSPVAAGLFAGSLDILSNDQQQSVVTFNVAGGGSNQIVPPELKVTEKIEQSFNQVVPGTSVAANVTLENVGTGPLHVLGLDVSGLSAPVSLGDDKCTGKDLLAAQSCVFQVQFAPRSAGPYAGVVVVDSNDPLFPQTPIPITGLSNTPPPAASLQSPADGSSGWPQTVTLTWSQLPDDDGHPVTNAVQLDTNPHFLTRQVIPVAGTVGSALAVGAFVCLIPFGMLRRQRYLLVLLLGAGLLLLVSCGSGGGGSSGSAYLRSQSVGGLDPGTTYYWQVISEDGQGGVSQSSVFSFTTQ